MEDLEDLFPEHPLTPLEQITRDAGKVKTIQEALVEYAARMDYAGFSWYLGKQSDEVITTVFLVWTHHLLFTATVMEPIDNGFKVPPAMAEALHIMLRNFEPDKRYMSWDDQLCSNEVHDVMWLLLKVGDEDIRTARLYIQEIILRDRAPKVGWLLIYGVSKYARATTPGFAPHEIELRAAQHRAQLVHIRRIAQDEANWCGECLPLAHRIMTIARNKREEREP